MSSSLLFPQRFGWYVLRPSSGVCQTQEPSWNFKQHPLLNPQGSPILIPLTITRYKCYGIRTGDPRVFNKGRSSKFCVGSWVRQTTGVGRRTYWLKREIIKMKTIVQKPLMIKKYIYNWSTIVEGDPKVPFSIATTQTCRGGNYSFPWFVPYPSSIPYNAVF